MDKPHIVELIGKKVVLVKVFARFFYRALFYPRYVRAGNAERMRDLALRKGDAVLQPVAHGNYSKFPLVEYFFEQCDEFFALNALFHLSENIVLLFVQKVYKRKLVAVLVGADGVGYRHDVFMLFTGAQKH